MYKWEKKAGKNVKKSKSRDYSWRAKLVRNKKKIYLGRKNRGARKVIRTPRLRKKSISGKTKQGKNVRKSGSGD